jgi:hypothetical protein
MNLADSFAPVQRTTDRVAIDGVVLPTSACTRGPERRPIREMLMVWIDPREMRFS